MRSCISIAPLLPAIAAIVFGIFGSSTYGYEEKSGYTSWGNLNAWDSSLPGSNFQASHTLYIFGTEEDVPDWYEDPSEVLDTSVYSVESTQTMGWSFHVDSVTLDSANFGQLTAGSSPTWLELSTSYTAITLGSDAPTSFTLGGVDSAMYILLDNVSSIDVEGTTSGTQRTLTINASIFGSGFYKTGGGILKLTNDGNFYTGGTEINAGTLAISSDGDLGDTSGTLYLNGGTLRSDATFSLSSSRGVGLEGGGYIDTNGYHLTIPGTISDDGPLIKQGTGTLTISGNKSGAGEIEVSGGTLEVSSTSFTTGSPSTYSAIGDEGTGTLTQSAGTSTFNSGDVFLGYGSSDVGTYNLENSSTLVVGSVSNEGDLYVGNYGQGTFNQSGSSSSTVYGDLYISNSASSFNLSGGTLVADAIENVGTFTQTGGTLDTFGIINVGTFNQSDGAQQTVYGTFYNYTGATYTLSGSDSTLTTDSTYGAANAINDGTFTESGGTAELANLSGDGSISLMGGTLALSGTSSYTGSIAINGGVLAIASDAAITGGITFGGGVLQFNNYTSSLTFDDVANLNLGAATGDASTLSTGISGSYGLTYSGPGTLILTGANTYAGDTAVSAGTLKYDITSGSVSVTDGATVTIASGAAIIADGSVDPFSSPAGSPTNFANIVNNSTISGGVGGFHVTAGTKAIGTLTGSGDTCVASGASLSVQSVNQNSLAVNGTLTVRSNGTASGTSVVKSLTISSGKFDLTNNALVVDYDGTEGGAGDPFSTIQGYLVSGYNSGSWGATAGLTTSAAVFGTSLGYAESNDVHMVSGIWAGQTVDSTSICVMYTWLGDLNLDGTVDSSDLAMMGNVPASGPEDGVVAWFDGDLNYDGVINSDDYALFSLGDAFQTHDLEPSIAMVGSPTPAEYLAEKEAEYAGESPDQIKEQIAQEFGYPVPEPVGSALLVVAPLFINRRRRC